MKYIPADKLIAEIESRMEDCKLPDGRFLTTTNIVRYEELSCLRNFITSLQQEQPEVNAELKRPISGAELKEVLDAAPKYPAGGHTAPKPEGNPVEQAISNGFAAVCAVLRYGYQQVEKAVNLCDERLDPGIVWNGRLFYLVEDVEIGSACEQCGIRTLCERLTEYDKGLCGILSGDSNHHFAEVH